MSDDAVELLRAILGELVGLRSDLAGQRCRQAPADRAALEALLPAVGAAVGERAFNLRELAAHAALPSETALRDAINVIGGPNRLGRLLKRGDGCDIGGRRLEHIGADRDGLVWRVRAAISRVGRARFRLPAYSASPNVIWPVARLADQRPTI